MSEEEHRSDANHGSDQPHFLSPIAGGAVEESFKSQLEFKPIGILKPSDAD